MRPVSLTHWLLAGITAFSFASAAQAQTTSNGNLDLSTAENGIQQYFYAAVAEELTLTVTAAQGKIAVTTRDAQGMVVQLGVAEPNNPFTVQGTYDELYASIAEAQGDVPIGTYAITFADGLAKPAGANGELAVRTNQGRAPQPVDKQFSLATNDSQQIFQGDGTECTTITINNAGAGVVDVVPTYVGDNAPRPPLPVGPKNSITVRCKLVALLVKTRNVQASGTYSIDG